MRPLALLKCLGRAFVRQVGRAVGLAWTGELVADVAEQAWKDWQRQRDEAQRRAEVEAVVRMAGQEFRRHVEVVVHEIAARQPAPVQQDLSRWLERIPDVLRNSTFRDDNRTLTFSGPLRDAEDLVSLLNSEPVAPEGVGIVEGDPQPRVVISCIAGPAQGHEFVFEQRTALILGRGEGCFARVPNEKTFSLISRHHCLLDINPPSIRVRDLGSNNGTFVDGKLLDRRPRGMNVETARALVFREADLRDNQVLGLGKRGSVAFRVQAYAPAYCGSCGAVMPGHNFAASAAESAPTLCRACSDGSAAHKLPKRGCAQCGTAIPPDAGPLGPGEWLCEECRRAPERIARRMQRQANGGAPEATAIHGYRMERLLGQGGQGAVWLAVEEETGTPKALKLLLPKGAANPRAVKRFLSEMANTRLLRHRHIVRLENIGFSQGAFFLVLEYCEGGSVLGLMKERGGPLPVDEAVEIALQALTGLDHAHRGLGAGKCLIHRDIKPANLFLIGRGGSRLVKIGDYGLSKAFDESGLSGSTRTGDIGGTPHFMCRQQVLEFKNAKPEVDVWGLAASLYKMLTGEYPREFPEGQDKWRIVLETDPIPIRRRAPAIPARLAGVIDHALQDRPTIPFGSAATFKEALEDAL